MRPLAFLATALGRPVLTAASCVRAVQTIVMPWDPTLYAIVDYLTGPALHAITWMALATCWKASSIVESVAYSA